MNKPERDLAAELWQWREVGQRFRYLGKLCVVVGYWEHIGEEMCPMLKYEYADDAGIIQSRMMEPIAALGAVMHGSMVAEVDRHVERAADLSPVAPK